MLFNLYCTLAMRTWTQDSPPQPVWARYRCERPFNPTPLELPAAERLAAALRTDKDVIGVEILPVRE